MPVVDRGLSSVKMSLLLHTNCVLFPGKCDWRAGLLKKKELVQPVPESG